MATDRIPFFSVVDRNKDGVIDLEEFERCWTGLRLSDTCKLKPDEAFRILDKDNNSHLDIKEFQKFVETMQNVKELEGEFKWGYDSDNGPAVWPSFFEAARGKEQSPIDIDLNEGKISDAKGQKAEPVFVGWMDSAEATLVNNGHTMQWTIEGDAGGITFNGKDYKLLQFHFHIPSELFINGKPKNIEIHFVHQCQADKQLAVLGFLFELGENGNKFVDEMIKSKPMSEKGAQAKVKGIPLNALTFENKYVHYDGSLTTPPCSEGVKWFVNRTMGTVTEAQLSWFRKCIDHNNARPPCALHDRQLCMRQIQGFPAAE